MGAIDPAELAAWNVANERARHDYRLIPTEFTNPRWCLTCTNRKSRGRRYCGECLRTEREERA